MNIVWEPRDGKPGARELFLGTADALWDMTPNQVLFMFEGEAGCGPWHLAGGGRGCRGEDGGGEAGPHAQETSRRCMRHAATTACAPSSKLQKAGRADMQG
jgi:hypothetical protein